MSHVVIEDGFAQYGRRFDHACQRAIIEGAQATLNAARGTVPKGETGRLERSLRLTELTETTEQLTISVVATAFYGRFLEFGTLGGRKRKLRAPEKRRRSAAEGSGISPRYFMLKAGRLGAPGFAAAVAREIGRLGR
jgi:hypothetical protein